VIIVAAVAALAVLMMALVRRRAGGRPLAEPTRGTPMIMMVSTAFAVLLAFVTFASFQTYNGAKSGAREEAVAVMEMFRTAALFSPQERDELRADFICYSRAVPSQEWPAMRKGGASPVVERWIASYRSAFGALGLRSPREQIGFQELLAEARNRTDGRRERLTQATPSIPLPLWLVLLLGGSVAVTLQLSMTDRRERFAVQGTMIAGVAAVVAAGLLLVYFLDHPYQRHVGSVEPGEIRNTLVMMHAQAPGLALPCRPDGRPAAG